MGTTGRGAHAWLGALLVAVLAAGASVATLAQVSGVLRVTLSLGSGDGARLPVRRHALLVSDTPPSRAPWRVVIGADGTGRVTLPPGTYVVESEEPLVAQGRAYEWRQTVEVTAAGEVTLTLTEANADVSAPAATTAVHGAPARLDPWDLLLRWQDSVAIVWTPDRHASGIVVAPTGLIATTHRAVAGAGTDVEVQVGPRLKVAARVVAADAARDVALLQVAPAVVASREPVPLGCDGPSRPALSRGAAVSAISTPLRRQPTTSVGRITRIETGPLAAVFDIPIDSAGGPVFAEDGQVIGLASLAPGDDRAGAVDADITRVEAICALVDEARGRIASGTPPEATPRPVEAEGAVAEDVLTAQMKARTGSLRPPQVASDGFDVALLTPVIAYAALQTGDFGQWTRYVADRLPVLLVRVTPKQTESFWMKVARGAALTQGVALPPITRFEPGFLRMRGRCGDREWLPIHPFRIERRVGETAAIREGLYVFAPDVLSACRDVTLEIFSEKAPERGERVTIDEKVVDQVRRDLASTPGRP